MKAKSGVRTSDIRKPALESKEDTAAEIGRGTDQMCQLMNCLIFKHETLSLIPKSTLEKPGIVKCTYDLSAGEERTGRLLGLTGQPASLAKQDEVRESLSLKRWPTITCETMPLHTHSHRSTHRTMINKNRQGLVTKEDIGK